MERESEIKETARDWLLRLSLDSPSADERAEFAAWCAQDPRHLAAYQRYESIWQDSTALEDLKPLAALPKANDSWWACARARIEVHSVRWAASASLLALVTASLWYTLTPTHYATRIGEVREIHLSDGSEVTLGARSSIEVAFASSERRVALSSGVAFFSVSKDPHRPFTVRVGDKEVRVVGTKFEILRDPDSMRVSVVEGTVEVMQVPAGAAAANHMAPRSVRLEAGSSQPAAATLRNGEMMIDGAAPPSERVLTAGQRVTAALTGAISDPQSTPPGEAAAWRHGRLVYVDTPLRDIIADANRYSRHPIEIDDDSIANVRVSVTYPSNRIEEMVAALSQSLSLDVERQQSGVEVLKARKRVN